MRAGDRVLIHPAEDLLPIDAIITHIWEADICDPPGAPIPAATVDALQELAADWDVDTVLSLQTDTYAFCALHDRDGDQWKDLRGQRLRIEWTR